MTLPSQHPLRALLLASTLLAPAAAFAQDTTASPATGLSIAQSPVPEDEVVATGVFVPNEKKITSEITSVLDEEIFAQTGAGDIASALTRVTGLSLAQGKFVIVRGLNERYSSATLNGGPLPSPEPLRRVAPLDLFPTSILSDVVVSKTYSPEFSGEFGGGQIDLRTRSLPDEGFFEISVSGSANTQTTLRDGLVYDGSDTDFLGFDDGLRDLPELDASGLPTENFENFSTLIIDRKDNIPFNGGLRLSGGKRIDTNGAASFGVFGTVGYDNAWETREGVANQVRRSGDRLETRIDLDRNSTENAISLNGLLGVGVEFDQDHTVQALAFATRQSSAEARIDQGSNEDGDLIRRDNTEWFEREVYMGQLLGEHYLPDLNDLEVQWRASYAVAGRDAPYERNVAYIFENGGFQFDSQLGTDSNEIRFSELDDETLDFGLDLTLPVTLGLRDAEVKVGAAYLDKQRDAQVTGFNYAIANSQLFPQLLGSRADVIFSDPVVDAGILEIQRTGTRGEPDASDTGLTTYGAYAQFETEITDNLRATLGARYDTGEQTTVASDLQTGTTVEFAPLDEGYFLPAATATLTFLDNWQLRLAASKTINRPQFRELTPTRFINTDTEELFIGNPFLVNSEATNLDARVEYYFASDQFFTIGGFYKDLTNPIEEYIQPVGETTATSFINAPSAEVFGVEVEFEKKFAIGTDLPVFDSLIGGQDFVVRSNYTYVDSSVSADGDVDIFIPQATLEASVAPLTLSAEGLFTDGRKLQGQSDHLANLQLGIENYEQGWDAFLLLNYSSERIRAVETRTDGLPAIDEQLPITLDFVTNIPLEVGGGEYQLGLKVQNILGEGYEASQTLGDSRIVIDSYDVGTTFSASLKRTF